MRFIVGILAALLPFFNFAAEEGLDQKIDNFFRPIADFIGGIVFYSVTIADKSVPIVLIILIGGALFFTIFFKFANFRLIPKAIKERRL
jgi:AGCS family alanine or glycine:cation symporter